MLEHACAATTLSTYLPTYDELRGGDELVPGGGSVVSQ